MDFDGFHSIGAPGLAGASRLARQPGSQAGCQGGPGHEYDSGEYVRYSTVQYSMMLLPTGRKEGVEGHHKDAHQIKCCLADIISIRKDRNVSYEEIASPQGNK